MTHSDTEIVELIWKRFRAVLEESAYQLWFEGKISLAINYEKKSVTVLTLNAFISRWHKKNYQNILRDILSEVLGYTPEVTYSVAEENESSLAGSSPVPTIPVQPEGKYAFTEERGCAAGTVTDIPLPVVKSVKGRRSSKVASGMCKKGGGVCMEEGGRMEEIPAVVETTQQHLTSHSSVRRGALVQKQKLGALRQPKVTSKRAVRKNPCEVDESPVPTVEVQCTAKKKAHTAVKKTVKPVAVKKTVVKTVPSRGKVSAVKSTRRRAISAHVVGEVKDPVVARSKSVRVKSSQSVPVSVRSGEISSSERPQTQTVPVNTLCRVRKGTALSMGGVENMSSPSELPVRVSRKFGSLENFVVGTCNRDAFKTVQASCLEPGVISPVVIYGPAGVGKTHLLEAAWTAATKQGLKPVYVTAEEFTSEFIESVRNKTQSSFRARYRKAQILLLDNIDFFFGKRCTISELQYTIDAVQRAGHQLIMTSHVPMEELSELGVNIRSKLEAAVWCRVDYPCVDVRYGVLTNLAKQRGVTIPVGLRRQIATQLRTANEIKGALNKLVASSRAWGQPVNQDLVDNVMPELVSTFTRVIRMEEIEKAVCAVLGMEASTLRSGSRQRSVSQPRMLALWLARKYTRRGLAEIGKFFGCGSHSTVIMAQKRVDSWLNEDASVMLSDRMWNVDDAVRRVEQTLRSV